MRMQEDFDRCKCGCAWVSKEEFITGTYKGLRSFIEKPTKYIEYRCKDCRELLATDMIKEGE